MGYYYRLIHDYVRKASSAAVACEQSTAPTQDRVTANNSHPNSHPRFTRLFKSGGHEFRHASSWYFTSCPIKINNEQTIANV